MYQENEFDKLEALHTVSDGLNSLQHMLEIVELSGEHLSYKDLAGLLGALSYSMRRQTEQTVALLRNK